ncbi:ABC transporter ATP-binding protein [uncultured Desulfosarcina sp.]|uniref:ABC transporter ATP-binding protein n=1 Tax=uncultured Desulfosarcina sp. TaxID=218289 RepID=UPI0029C84E35|nr:ABC transporter ATP-binding protein [uncultured Desulfosarcina sp.]
MNSENTMTAIVSCQGVSKTYRQGKVSVAALSAIDLTAEAGEFLALAGPSGSGKTTLLNLIGGLDVPDDGQIQVGGQSYDELSDAQMADLRLHRIGFIFQAYNLIPVLSALENVEYVMLLQGTPAVERKKRAREILDIVGLEGKYDRRPAELSGGQQQRVAVARAIVSSPDIVLADEPTANLDSKTGESLLELMRQMNRERNATFIFSTHDPMVMEYARRIVLLRDGRITEDNRKT